MKYIVTAGRSSILFNSREEAGRALDVITNGIIVEQEGWDSNAPFKPSTESNGEISLKTIPDSRWAGAENEAKAAFEAAAVATKKYEEANVSRWAAEKLAKDLQAKLDAIVKPAAPESA